MNNAPELLAPAGNLERLKVAVLYGADAVYLGGQRYGLRARADNFTRTELEQGVAFAHSRGARVYVTLNAFLHDHDFEGFADYCRFLEEIGVDAVIASDLGVIRTIQSSSNLTIHLSTQASCLNTHAARAWRALGVKRIVLGREVSIVEAARIKHLADVEVELFVHGAMCMSFSGNCTISNFTAGRDSNRGGCIQSCRYTYTQTEETRSGKRRTALAILPPEDRGVDSNFMSSMDLRGLEHISDFCEHGISSLKIEGRMKSPFYVASTCKAYRAVLDCIIAGLPAEQALADAEQALASFPHRDYCSGSLHMPAKSSTVYQQKEPRTTGTHDYTALVLDSTEADLVLRLFAPLKQGDRVDFLPFSTPVVTWEAQHFLSVSGEPISESRQDTIIRVPRTEALQAVEPLNVVRQSKTAPEAL